MIRAIVFPNCSLNPPWNQQFALEKMVAKGNDPFLLGPSDYFSHFWRWTFLGETLLAGRAPASLGFTPPIKVSLGWNGAPTYRGYFNPFITGSGRPSCRRKKHYLNICDFLRTATTNLTRLPSLKLTCSPLKSGGFFQVRNLQTSRGPYFQVFFAVSFREVLMC